MNDSQTPVEHETQTLLREAAAGDHDAADLLFRRYAPVLHRWARGRMPRWARDLADTSDLVQETLLDTFRNIHRFEYRGEGAFFAYLRQALMNRIGMELRRHRRQPNRLDLDSSIEDQEASPLEQAIGAEVAARYETALARLTPLEREAVIARVELRLPYKVIADALGKRTPDAARVLIARALVRLAREMHRSD